MDAYIYQTEFHFISSYSRPELVKTTHIHLDLDLDFDAKTLSGECILSMEKMDQPGLWPCMLKALPDPLCKFQA